MDAVLKHPGLWSGFIVCQALMIDEPLSSASVLPPPAILSRFAGDFKH